MAVLVVFVGRDRVLLEATTSTIFRLIYLAGIRRHLVDFVIACLLPIRESGVLRRHLEGTRLVLNVALVELITLFQAQNLVIVLVVN